MRKVMSLLLSGAAAMSVAACSSEPEESGSAVPLYDNLGDYHHEITTTSDQAQQYFDQGLRLSYAFNHAEAIRSFQQAAELDPGCAMCYWGVAYALGPNINAPITEDAARQAWTAIGEARERAADASDRERAYIEALANRYTDNPAAERAPLDRAYSEAMRQVAAKFPDDPDARTLFAQSVMDTSPWNYWQPDGTPHPFTQEVLETLESVLADDPDHLGAIHLYIHATEASDNPGRAERYADTLLTLAPGAGHLVHMPAHTYLRTGRYADATASNEAAAEADKAYLAGNKVDANMTYEMGYVPHNLHFIATSAAMEGRRARALEAADETRAMAHPDMFRDPAMGGMVQHFALTPLYTMLRFGMWDQILVEPQPAQDLPFMRAIWHMARGMAFASIGQLTEADRELAALTPLRSEAALAEMWVSSANVASNIVGIAHEVLQGELAAKRRRAADVTRHYEAAVAIEDALTYMEPPDWPVPVRQLQGAALLEVGRAAEAAAAFRGDMEKYPENGWSLSGLQSSLEAQGQGNEAADVKIRLDRAWSAADVPVVGARAQAPPAAGAKPVPSGC